MAYRSNSYTRDWRRLQRQFEQDDSSVFGPEATGFRSFGTPEAGAAQWDPVTGMPIGLSGPPDAAQAPAYQWRHNQMVEARNAEIRQQALAAMQGGQAEAQRVTGLASEDAMNWANLGARSSESFRPGGYANFDSFGLRANLAMQKGQSLANIAMQGAQSSSELLMNSQLQQQDLMASWRAQQEADARNQERRAARMNAYQSFIQGSTEAERQIDAERRSGSATMTQTQRTAARWNTNRMGLPL